MPNEEHSLAEKLRLQRDRFIAFAFAGADLLLEMRDGDIVSYSAGAGEALCGISDNDLLNKALLDFVFPRDRVRFAEALQRLHNTGRLDHTPLTLVGSSGALTRMRMAGIRLPQFPTGYHLVLSRVPPIAAPEEAGAGADADPRVQFVDLVRQRLNEANRLGEEYTLTLFDLSDSNFGSCEPATLTSFLATLHHTLEECSVRQSSAGTLTERAFGLVHDRSVTAMAVQRKVSEVLRKFGGKVQGAEIKMRSAMLEMDDSSLSDEDIGKALSFIVNSFTRDSGQFAIKSLADGARVAIEDTLVRVRNFRKMVKGDRLTFLFQPIVNLHSGSVLKYEAFSRIAHPSGYFNPSQIIPFATEVGIIGEFDLIAVKKALDMMKAATDVSALAHVSVNVSGTSLGNPGFYHALLKILEEHKGLLARLVIEITDAARIYNLDEARRLLIRIRRLGARLSLDDFGSGGAAFDCLKALPVDYAKIDSAYVLDAREKRGRSVLRAISGLCKDLDIITIGECVEDGSMVDILKDVGIDYAQGHFFAAPAPDAAKKVRYYKEHLAAAGAKVTA
jgi:EAL domain-containing protein (putative c-di-GMP-specific phosphodiesterase class I)